MLLPQLPNVAVWHHWIFENFIFFIASHVTIQQKLDLLGGIMICKVCIHQNNKIQSNFLKFFCPPEYFPFWQPSQNCPSLAIAMMNYQKMSQIWKRKNIFCMKRLFLLWIHGIIPLTTAKFTGNVINNVSISMVPYDNTG